MWDSKTFCIPEAKGLMILFPLVEDCLSNDSLSMDIKDTLFSSIQRSLRVIDLWILTIVIFCFRPFKGH